MPSIGSITKLLGPVKLGDATAAEKLWKRFSAQLLRVARNRLPGGSRAGGDEEDVVLSAFGTFFTGARLGKFQRLHDRWGLWQLLALITRRKAIKAHAREERQKGIAPTTSGASPCQGTPSLSQLVIDRQPSPELRALTSEQCERLLDALSDAQLRSIAMWKMEAYTDAEIAGILHCTVRTVERKLWLIRRIWIAENVAECGGCCKNGERQAVAQAGSLSYEKTDTGLAKRDTAERREKSTNQ
ncbi:MAG TPA: ECF-type sigma factor [Gemmataceae bacterium]|nr:ECF-type sigma factor [Gemmataceae bacterium]